MSNQLARQGAPSFVLYITGLSFIYFLISGLSFALQSVSEGTILAEKLINDAFVLSGLSIATLGEIFFLRKNMRLAGGFGIGLGVETIKTISSVSLLQSVGDTTLFFAFSAGGLGTIIFSKAFRERIDAISQTDVSKNVLNIVPPVFFLLAFTGGSLLSSLGFGAASQINNPEYFDTSDVDFSLFNQPSWNAAYYLQNLMDQMTAGLLQPDLVVFNITNINPDPWSTDPHSPLAYYKTGIRTSYEYNDPIAFSGSWFTQQSDALRFDLEPTYSQPIPSEYRLETETVEPTFRNNTVVTLQIDHEINYSTTSFRESIPVVWSGAYGSYINRDSIRVGDQFCSSMGDNCKIYENTNDITNNLTMAQNIELDLQGLPAGPKEEVPLTYTQDFLVPNYLKIQQTAQPVGAYGNPELFSPGEWSAIQNVYLQLPNTADGTLITGPSINNYTDWSPTLKLWTDAVAENITNADSVFTIAYTFARSLNPTSYGNPEQIYPQGTFNIINGDKLYFDNDSWIGEFVGNEAPHPDPGVDYVEWFLNRGGGIGLHFATTLAMMLRYYGIPTRLVEGYSVGDIKSDPVKTLMQSYYRHAWVEVLVPLYNTLTDSYSYEWVIFDPIASVRDIDSSTVLEFIDPYQYEAGSIDPLDILGNMTKRVGVDYKSNATGSWIFDGVYDRATELDRSLLAPIVGTSHLGHVRIGVYTAAANKLGSFPTGGYFPIPDTPVTFVLLRINPDNTTSLKEWGPDPNSPGNTTNVFSVTIYSDSQGLAETEFIYRSPVPHGPTIYNFVALYGAVTCDASGSCLKDENNNSLIGAISDNIVDAKEFGIGSLDGDSIVYEFDTLTAEVIPNWSPIRFSVPALEGSSDIPNDNVNYTYWENPQPQIRFQTLKLIEDGKNKPLDLNLVPSSNSPRKQVFSIIPSESVNSNPITEINYQNVLFFPILILGLLYIRKKNISIGSNR